MIGDVLEIENSINSKGFFLFFFKFDELKTLESKVHKK